MSDLPRQAFGVDLVSHTRVSGLEISDVDRCQVAHRRVTSVDLAHGKMRGVDLRL